MASRISVSNLASLMAEASGRSKKNCEDFLKEFFKLAGEVLASGENLRIKGFGNFKISEVETRSSVNVSTGEKYDIEAHNKIVFTPSKELAALINSPFEAFESIEMEDEMPDFVDEDDSVQEVAIEENEPSNPILEAGSDEEEFDDELTYEAYADELEESYHPSTLAAEKQESVKLPDQTMTAPQEVKMHEGSETTESTETIESKPQNPVIMEKEKTIASEPEVVYVQGPDRFGRGFFSGAMTSLAVCLIIFMLGCFFGWWPVNFGNPEELETQPEKPQIVVIEQQANTDIEPPQEDIEEEKVYDHVSTTRYLTTIAREHYGNFNFWPYIYIENQKILGHPDRITPGTKVVVPPLSKYGVDPKNKKDEAEAKKKGLEIYSKYK